MSQSTLSLQKPAVRTRSVPRAEECRGEWLPGALSFSLEFSFFFSGKWEQWLKIVAMGKQIGKIPDANVQKLPFFFPLKWETDRKSVPSACARDIWRVANVRGSDHHLNVHAHEAGL